MHVNNFTIDLNDTNQKGLGCVSAQTLTANFGRKLEVQYHLQLGRDGILLTRVRNHLTRKTRNLVVQLRPSTLHFYTV
jgi:hypothetical protein